MYPHQDHHEDHEDPRAGVMAAITGGCLALLLAAGTALAVLRSAELPLAHVGDIVAFNQPGPRSGQDVTAERIAGGDCVLDPATLASSGGSLVVEGQFWQQGRTYRVHWAGAHTASGAGDCGASADLAINEMDLTSLAIVAGGYGVQDKTIALAYPGGATSMALN